MTATEPPHRTIVAVAALSVAVTVAAVALYPLRVIAAHLANPVLRLCGRAGTLRRGEWGGTEIVLDRRALQRR